MYYNCESLTILPNISKWFTFKVKNMSYMFYNCKSLKSIPEIGKWRFEYPKLVEFNNIFEGCSSLRYYPNIFNIPSKPF